MFNRKSFLTQIVCRLRGHKWVKTSHRNGHEFDTVTYRCNRCGLSHSCTTDAMDLPR
jgi:hypothetical protein